MSNAGQGPTAAKPILLCELAIQHHSGKDGMDQWESIASMVSDASDEESPIKLS